MICCVTGGAAAEHAAPSPAWRRVRTPAPAQGLNNHQLAVLFRANHFNVLFRRRDSLYVLVTDQGYLYEKARSASVPSTRCDLPCPLCARARSSFREPAADSSRP